MTRVVRRISLVAQVADLLREHLDAGRWRGRLPGQRALSRELQVSCRTLRAAMKLLAREGRLGIAHGRPTRALARARGARRGAGRVVRLLLSQPLHELAQINLYRFGELRRCLMDAGYELEVHLDPGSPRRGSAAGLEALARENPAACWVLHVSKPETQRWFAERDLPAVVSKSSHPGVRLPSVDVDFRALGHHAAGLFLGLGHRRVALLMLQARPANEAAIEEGFLGGFHGRHAGSVARVGVHDATVPGICRALDALLKEDRRPTGILCTGTGFAFATMGALAQRGVRVPGDVSLATQVADSPLVRYACPSLAHYRIDWDLYARRLTRLVIRVATAGAPEPRHVLLLPEFQAGESLAPVPARKGGSTGRAGGEPRRP
jgi:LacI family transcriptional regulator